MTELGIPSDPTFHTHGGHLLSVWSASQSCNGQACLRFLSSSPFMACTLLFILFKWLYWLAVHP